jgi:thiol-disulfide isomerase/thioredoxin
MRAVSCMIVLACLCLTGTGCSLFQKNPNGTTASAGAGTPPPKFPAAQDPLLNSNVGPPPPLPTPPVTQTSGAKAESMLAGTVRDAYYRPISNAYIRWVNLDEKDAGAPVDITTDTDGNFIIRGLKQGEKYKLIARTKQGEKMLAGTVFTSAPNYRVQIPVREDLVNADTPPLPGTPSNQGKAAADGAAWSTSDGPKKPGETPNLPATIIVPVAPPSTAISQDPPSALSTPIAVPGLVESANPNRLPMLTIPSAPPPKAPALPNNPPRPPALTPSDAKFDTGPTRVPSCVLVGNHLENMALKDSKGQTWEYKKQGYGKLVLIDFWRTDCKPCRDNMPALERLHKKYAARGLEVIGIAQELGVDERREADAVNRVCASLQVTYRQLLGRYSSPSLDVGKEFRIEGVPTLFLLNERGDITWYKLGGPDARLLEALDRTIDLSLSKRAPL